MAKKRKRAIEELTEELPEHDLKWRYAATEFEHVVHFRPIHFLLLPVDVVQENIQVLVEGQPFGGMLRRQLLQLGDHPFQGDIAELDRVIGFLDVPVALGQPAAADVAMVPGKVDLFDIFMVVLAGLEVLLQQGRLELAPTLIDGDGMSDVPGGAGHGGQIGFGGEGQIKVSDGVDGVEQAEEMHLDVFPAKRRPEAVHPFSMFVVGFEVADAVLIILIGLVGKGHHLFVAFGQHPDGGDHPGEEAGGEGAAGEAEEVDLVALFVIPHDEAIGGDDVGIKGGADALIDHLRDGSLEAPPGGGVHRLVPGRVGSNAG